MIKTFQNIENDCKFTFENAVRRMGPFWHICTPGYLTEILNITPDDYKFSVSNLAISAFETGVAIVTDAHMENHIHILAGCRKEKCQELLERYLAREKRYLTRIGRTVNLLNFKCDDPIAVDSLDMIRNEIAYINRNGYVANPSFTPYSYPWGGGCLYFNLFAQRETGIKYNDLPFKEKRNLCRQRVEPMPDCYTVREGMILPSGYVNYKLGEAMFRNAQHYFSLLSRNFEAYSAEAKRMGDSIVLTSEELYPAVRLICQNRFNSNQPGLLPPAAKIEVAKIMRSDYHATNPQIQRILNLSKQYVEQLFPLSSKK